MNKSDLIDAVNKTTSLAKREADEAVNALIYTITSEVKAGRRVVIAGFGSFNPTRREARTGRNPQTGAPVAVPATRGVRFAASAMFKDVLNGRARLPARKPTASSPKAVTGTGSRTASVAARTAKKGTTSSTNRGPKAKKAAGRAPAREAAERTTTAAAHKIVRRVPAKKVAKRVRASKAAKQSARKAVRRAPARKSSKRVRARKAVKRSARRP